MHPGRLLLAAALAMMIALSYGAHREDRRAGAAALSPEQEVDLGPGSRPLLAALGGLDADADAQAELARIGGRLVANAGDESAIYRFHFLMLAEAHSVNAYALPGGSIFVTRALYSRLRNEAELAGVLGHEIGHVVAGTTARVFSTAEEDAADAESVDLMAAAGYDPQALVGALERLGDAADFAHAHAGTPDRAARLAREIAAREPAARSPAALTVGRAL